MKTQNTPGSYKQCSRGLKAATLLLLAPLFLMLSPQSTIAIDRGDPQKAIELLSMASEYELGEPVQWPSHGTLYPVYVRGEAYLRAGDAVRAATEFQKIVDHRGVVANFPLGALARVQLGRAYKLGGDVEKAREAYAAFLVVWLDADPNIPILKQAKSEYAKLR